MRWTFIAREVLFTREGRNGARQVETRGLIATAFTHRDSRAGDPDLHTHIAVANKVQTQQGKWLSIFGKVLHEHVVAASETYNTALDRHLVERVGVRFAERPGTARQKRPVREIVGVDKNLCERWSQRRADIARRQRELSHEFTKKHGRPPTPVEAVALAQRANLETRDAKHEPRSEGAQREGWRSESIAVLGSRQAVDAMIATALHPVARSEERVTANWVRATAERVVTELEAHRATWQSWHVTAEAQRQIRDAALTPDRVAQVGQWVVDEVERLTINLTPEHDLIAEPNALCRSDGESVYRHTGRDHFTSRRILDAEQRITHAAGVSGGLAFTPDEVELSMLAAALDGDSLNPGQQALVTRMATGGRRVQLALAPAGSGKTTAMRVLANVWTDVGMNAVGLAPSAAAAAALSEATRMPSETLAKLAYDLTAATPTPLADSIRPNTLVVIDEAGMADTLALDRAVTYALSRGATVRLIGDDQQLAAIGAGGVLRDIAATHGAVRLNEVVRFADPVEADATLALRDGDVAALGYYLDHGRVHVGDTDTCIDEVFDAWTRERAGGRDCLMLAPSRELVAELNGRARGARLAGARPGDEVQLSDGSRASVGDTVISRRNDRRLGVSGTDWVKNGDRWIVTAVRHGSLSIIHRVSGLSTTLPASYVAEHVELGYASTVHTAQGLTADAMHGIVTGDESRQLLYTMLSRGRSENHVHVLLAPASDPHQVALPGVVEQLTATETLEAVLERDGAAVSATTRRAHAEGPAELLHDAVSRYDDALTTGAQRVLGTTREDALGAAGKGPVPWLAGIPDALREHAQWSAYLEARARRVSTLADQVRAEVLNETPSWAERFRDILDPDLRAELNVWRAGNGIGDDEHRIAGPRVSADRSEASYFRSLMARIDARYGDIIKTWEQRIIEHVGRRDEHTTDLAVQLDRLKRSGTDAEQVLARAATRRRLPDDHATAALAYRIREQLRPARRAHPATPDRIEPTGYEPPTQAPGLGL